jgi:YVTN family beta-propeller protein
VIPIGGNTPRRIAITPDGTKAYVASDGGLTPITVATNTAGTTISTGGSPMQAAITPDQAPVASFTASTAGPGSPAAFDASASTVKYGSIVCYAWDFGDGQTATTTTPTTTHTYASVGSYTAKVTETDTAGTSTTKVFTGQTMSRNGGSSAVTTRTVTVSPFGWVSPPGDVSFSLTLNGQDQVASATLPLDVGSGVTSGWNITATSTTFTAPGGKQLATGAVSVPVAPTDTCDTTCTLATNGVAYPYTLPAGATAPAATKLFQASSGTGNGNQTVTPAFKLAVPANTVTGTYTSTWTVSLVSGP